MGTPPLAGFPAFYPQKNGHFLSGEFSVCASHRVLAFPATDDPQQPRQWPNPPPRL
ncbi:hypothetical protein HMPREF0580_2367, partial [Mobiluncus mulieris ATCC 35239]